MDPFIVWAAGFFDGEGCVTINASTGNSLALRVAVTNIHRPALIDLQTRFGGFLKQQKAVPNHRPCYQLILSAYDGARFLRDLLPYMVVKRDVAILGLAFHATSLGRGKRVPPELQEVRQAIREQIQHLNRRSVP